MRLIIALGLFYATSYAQDVENNHARPNDWEEINFETNQAVLVDGFPSLLRLADLLKAHPNYKVTIVGNADQRGSNRANDALSLRRANVVAQFLQKYGATATQVQVRGDGKKNPENPGRNRNALFMNRRVNITVTAPDGVEIGDGGIGSAIEEFMTYSRTQFAKLDDILRQLQALEAQVRTLNTADIKQDTTQIRQDTTQLKQDTAAIKQDTGALVQRPVPLTQEQTTKIAHDAADYALTQSAIRNRKYTLLGFDAGPTFAPNRIGDYSAEIFGKALIPFGNGKTEDQPGTHGFLIDGDWVYAHQNARRTTATNVDGLSDAILNTGLLNRFGHVQLGTFAQFDYAAVSLNQYLGNVATGPQVFTRAGAFLGGGVVTLNYVLNGATFGVFGAKGFKDTGILTGTTLNSLTTPVYLRYADQAGIDFAGTFRKFQIEGSLAFVKRYTRALDEQPSGMLKVSFGPTDTMQFFIEGDANTTFNGFTYGDRVVFGIQFGNWVRARNYGSTQGVVPVSVPRPHYELLTR